MICDCWAACCCVAASDCKREASAAVDLCNRAAASAAAVAAVCLASCSCCCKEPTCSGKLHILGSVKDICQCVDRLSAEGSLTWLGCKFGIFVIGLTDSNARIGIAPQLTAYFKASAHTLHHTKKAHVQRLHKADTSKDFTRHRSAAGILWSSNAQ